MKKIVLIAVMAILAMGCTATFADTNDSAYVSGKVGASKLRDSNATDYEVNPTYGISIGKFIHKDKLAIEFEVSHQSMSYNETVNSVNYTTTTTPDIVTTTTTPGTECQGKPGNGKGWGWGWWKNHECEATPPTTVTTITPGSTIGAEVVVPTNIKTDVKLTTFMINGIYRLTNNSMFTPYGLIGAGATIVEVDYSYDDFSETGFTYQAALGISLDITDDILVSIDARWIHTMFENDFELYGVQSFLSLTKLF